MIVSTMTLYERDYDMRHGKERSLRDRLLDIRCIKIIKLLLEANFFFIICWLQRCDEGS
jgi:hypothetical protein